MNDFTVKVWGVAPDGTELISGKDTQEIITLISSEIQAITKHNHALAAQVDVLNKNLQIAYDCLTCADETGYVEGCGFIDLESVASEIAIAISRTPQQHLAEIRADAVESAIKYCNLYLAFPVTKGDVAEEVLAISEIKMYAAKMRQGGE